MKSDNSSKKKPKVLLNKEYSWESAIDIEEDIRWELEELPGEFKGTIRVTVEYIGE